MKNKIIEGQVIQYFFCEYGYEDTMSMVRSGNNYIWLAHEWSDKELEELWRFRGKQQNAMNKWKFNKE